MAAKESRLPAMLSGTTSTILTSRRHAMQALHKVENPKAPEVLRFRDQDS
jgi:hypothetical protein